MSQVEKSEEFDDEFDDENENKSELDKLYETATLLVRKKANQISKEALLYFYARFKYINDGPCNTERPGGLFNFEAKSKWDIWNGLGSTLAKDEAKKQYLNKLDSVFPNWRLGLEENKHQTSNADRSGTFGIRMSLMSNEETDESDTNPFDACKNNNLDQLRVHLSKNKTLIDQVDEKNMTLLMWACDHGHFDVVKYLVEHGANLNVQDTDGQTCLHYAVSCEHLDIIKYLVESKIDADICDNDGTKAIDLVEDEQIKKILTNTSN
jgi:acyl-CoA-binding protein